MIIILYILESQRRQYSIYCQTTVKRLQLNFEKSKIFQSLQSGKGMSQSENWMQSNTPKRPV